MVYFVSDSPPGSRPERHKPDEREGQLASLLMARDPYNVVEIVPLEVDSDFGFFQSVLQSNLTA